MTNRRSGGDKRGRKKGGEAVAAAVLGEVVPAGFSRGCTDCGRLGVGWGEVKGWVGGWAGY